MFARFCSTYPAYTLAAAMALPWRQFLALHKAIDTMEAQAQWRHLETAVAVQYPGKRGEAVTALAKRLQAMTGYVASKVTTAISGVNPLMRTAEPGSIRAELERQKEVAARLEEEHRAKR